MKIWPAHVIARERHGEPVEVETNSSAVLLAFLRAMARSGARVEVFTHGGLQIEADSLSALNCYLRTARAMGRMKLPFDRLPLAGNHRFAWSDFCRYLALNFS